VLQFGDQQVDVLPPPVRQRQSSAILRVLRGVGEHLPGDRVRVEIVVEVHRVDVVAADRVHDRVLDQLAGLRYAGVVVQLAAVRDDPVRVLPGRMRRQQRTGVGVHRHPVRVEPRVQLEVALVRLADGVRERVVAGVTALRTGQVLRPRLDVRRPERVGGRPDLQHDGVVVLPYGVVQPGLQLGLLRGSGQSGPRRPVDVHHRRDPARSELPLRRRRVRRAGRGRLGRGTGLGRGHRQHTSDQARRHTGRTQDPPTPSHVNIQPSS
jgi:hypothetical protein